MKFYAEVRTPITKVLLWEGEVAADSGPAAAAAAQDAAGEYGTNVLLRPLDVETVIFFEYPPTKWDEQYEAELEDGSFWRRFKD